MNAIITFKNKAVNGITYKSFVQSLSNREIEQKAVIDDNGTERQLKINENTIGKFVRINNKTTYLNDLLTA